MSREMKDSGVQWIGKIPKEWEVKPLKAILEERNEKNLPIKSDNILSLTMDKGVIPYKDKEGGGNKAKEDLSAYKLAYPNDIVLNSMNVIAGSVGLSSYFGCVSPVYYTLYSRNNDDSIQYFNDIFQSKVFQLSLLGLGNGIMMKQAEGSGKLNTIRMRIPMQKLNTVVLPYPSKESQKQIANYLDKKVSQIDDIISKQKNLIEKYKAYKQSLITETVTKGLNKNVSMKESGIEWIGEVPSHWDVKKMKYLGTLNASGVDKKIRDGEKLYKSVHYVNVYKNGQKEIFNREDYLVISCDDSKATNCTLLVGDVLFTNSSETAEDMGACTVIAENLENTLFGYHLMRFRPDLNKLYYKYEKYLFSSNYMRKWFEYNSVGMTRYGLAQRGFAEAQIIYAPYEEQKKIADFLDKKCNAIDSAISKKEQLITKLEDYKKSLIYEYVTGKREVL
ncbi:restriction endonuclease subunit S [Clostridium sp.]|uniref:restriction endonuclease subunit S n=1 Tax=Clostridium sp. TaxID=1506 RepID=UPI001D901979|nr:restriction endonuclease subunit S [Clostridium sp.]MBS5937604.1 restriction endonuclease subunit S [Clostridium sp.]